MSDDVKNKLATALIAAATAFLVTKAIDMVWKMVTGNPPPSEDDPNTSTLRLALFAGITAVATALTRQATIKKTENYIALHR